MPPKRKSKLTREEILENKRKAERLRYERLKNDPQKREEMREKERLKYQKKKEKGSRKLVHRAAKKTWKEHCSKYRGKKKVLKEITNNFVRENTPNSESDHPTPRNPLINIARKKRKQRTKKLREMIIKDKDKKIYEYKKKLEKYKKRLQRLEKSQDKKNNIVSPNTKLLKMMDVPVGRKEIVKKALFGEVMNEQLKENYAKLKSTKDKQIFGKIVSGTLVDKYKLWRGKGNALSYKRVQKCALQPYSSLMPPKQTRRDRVPDECINAVRKFYENNDNS